MRTALLCSVTALGFIFTHVVMSMDKRSSFVDVEGSLSQRPTELRKKWEELPAQLRERIDSLCTIDLGLSSTGRIRLIGVYTQSLPGVEKPQRLFHLQQNDLFGSRLFWSILVDVEAERYRVLFHINQDLDELSWKQIKDR